MSNITISKDAFSTLLQDYCGMYTTPNEITIYSGLSENMAISIFCPFPGCRRRLDRPVLDLCNEFESFEDFVRQTNIRTIIELNNTYPDHLEPLYRQGKLKASCYWDYEGRHYSLLFRKVGTSVMVQDMEEPGEIEVFKKFHRPIDFMEYTQFYAKNKHDLLTS